MPEVTFIGDPNDEWPGPDQLLAYGYTFEKGEPLEVSDEWHLAKFRRNSHFSVAEPDVESGGDLCAKHVGRGVYYIMRGEDRLGTGIAKIAAEAFNVLSDDEKAAFVEGLD